ncbi:MAG: DUF1565 domain-containing protein [Okeania sp. SIO2C9]|uniref:DUF1565 domain-containing protein n=1 Tax=Okeania sp. SIO2C9 TaxID=2607791 RepID=UPI0013BF9C96|nr:DUF1565 domain-containing protein [Okeania sp. SIO2C9]NEQ75707.1 DUF1565 domain-containing protein [Okeania sp. SIO2C9]
MKQIFILFSQENNQTNLLRKINFLSPILATALLGIFTSASLAVPFAQQVAKSLETQANSQINVLYVSSSVGSDSGNGTKTAPLKTITYALKIAQPHTTILLSPGTYSRQTGEKFPLILQPKITIKGNYFNRGKNVLIQGGGDFNSPTLNQKNITIVAANQSNLTGITVINPNLQGYGLWIESSGCVISKNTFTGNTVNGISIVGSNTAIIQENNFYENRVSGITIYHNSQPEIRDNLFQNTGIGIKISDDAAPKVVGNRLIENESGIIIQGNTRPILRGNYIEGNRKDGVAAIAQSLPDLGNSQEPGRNTIRNNIRYNIYHAVKGQTLPAYGNSLGSGRNYGSIDIAGKIAPPPRVAPLPNIVTTPKVNPETESSQEEQVMETASTEAEIQTTSKKANFSAEAEKLQEGNSSDSIISSQRPGNSTTILIPVPAPETPRSRGNSYQTTSRQGNLQRLLQTNPNYQNTRAIEIPVSPPESRSRTLERWRNLPPRNTTPSFEPTTPVASPGLLSVPSTNIPLGRGGYVPPGIGRNQNPNPNPMPRLSLRRNSQSRAAALGLRYRVVVNVNNAAQTYKLRSLVPDAFNTNINGNSVMQAGAFRSRLEADQLLKVLRNNGLNAKVILIR